MESPSIWPRDDPSAQSLGLGGRGHLLIVISLVFNLLAVLLVVMRMLSRTLSVKERGLDDYTIVFSVVSY